MEAWKNEIRIFHPSTDERNRVGQLFEATINCPMAQHYHRPPLSWMWIDVSGVVSPAEGHGLLTTSYLRPYGVLGWLLARNLSKSGHSLLLVPARKYVQECVRATVSQVYRHALRGFAATIPASKLASVQADPRVESVTVDGEVRAAATQPPQFVGFSALPLG